MPADRSFGCFLLLFKVIVTKLPVVWPRICIKRPVLVVEILTERNALEALIIVGYLQS